MPFIPSSHVASTEEEAIEAEQLWPDEESEKRLRRSSEAASGSSHIGMVELPTELQLAVTRMLNDVLEQGMYTRFS